VPHAEQVKTDKAGWHSLSRNGERETDETMLKHLVESIQVHRFDPRAQHPRRLEQRAHQVRQGVPTEYKPRWASCGPKRKRRAPSRKRSQPNQQSIRDRTAPQSKSVVRATALPPVVIKGKIMVSHGLPRIRTSEETYQAPAERKIITKNS